MKKPFYKRWWFIVICAVFVIGVIGSLGNKDEEPVSTSLSSIAESPTEIESADKSIFSRTYDTVEEAQAAAEEYNRQRGIEEPIEIELFPWEEYYEDAVYEKFNTPASENGLAESLIKISGVVVDIDIYSEIVAVMIEDKNSNNWLLSLTVENNNLLSVGDYIDAYGSYQGVSSVYDNIPAMFCLRFVRDWELTTLSSQGLDLYLAYEGYTLDELQETFGTKEEDKTIMQSQSETTAPTDATTEPTTTATQPTTEPSQPTEPPTEETTESKDRSNIVYWSTGDKAESYHSTPECRSLARAPGIGSGTLEEAYQHGRTDPCNNCIR